VRAAGAGAVGDDAGRARAVAVGQCAPARELRRHDEFRHLPDVLHLARALSAVEAGGIRRARDPLPGHLEPLHPCGGGDALRAARPGGAAVAGDRRRLPGGLLPACRVGLRPAARHAQAYRETGLNPAGACRVQAAPATMSCMTTTTVETT